MKGILLISALFVLASSLDLPPYYHST